LKKIRLRLKRPSLRTLQSKPNKVNFTCGNKVFILGSGRAGTSFLTNLLSNLGLDAGLSRLSWYNNTRSGWEWNHIDVINGNPNSPYLIKNPHLTKEIDTLYKKYTIDCVIVPIRYSEDYIKSRQRNFNDYSSTAETVEKENGHLLSKLAYYDIPFVVLVYPKFVKDWKYAHQKINEVMAIIGKQPIEEKTFQETHSKLIF